jgi:hypothetical protein
MTQLQEARHQRQRDHAHQEVAPPKLERISRDQQPRIPMTQFAPGLHSGTKPAFPFAQTGENVIGARAARTEPRKICAADGDNFEAVY